MAKRKLFADPALVERLPLFGEADALWIEIKLELNAEDDRQLSYGALTRVAGRRDTADGSVESVYDIDQNLAAFNKVNVYLVDWNFTDAKDRPVLIDGPQKKFDALRSLLPKTYDEIERVIDDAVAARADQKKASNGSSEPAPISTSADSPDGPGRS